MSFPINTAGTTASTHIAADPAVALAVGVKFTDLGLSEPLLRAVTETGYTTPTPIQAQAIPQVLKGGDLLAAAQTGTGKTAGFTLPILHRLTTTQAAVAKPGRPRCLILVPTRELAAQVEESVRTYGKHVTIKSMVMFGGVNINPQYAALRGKVDILVATPGRLLDHVGQKTVDLSGVEILVLDEADRMLDMGFIRDIKKVIALIPKQRQTLLFSATFSDEIKLLANGLLNNPGTVEVARRNTASELVEQSVHMVAQAHKKDLLSHLIKHHNWQQVLVFTRTKHGANKLAEKLLKDNIPAAAIHGNKSQAARTRALADFKSSKLQVLVATDIAARGIDIDQLPQVVNFELPNVPEDYVHRIGRTGRAGTTGAAVSLVDREEMNYLKDIERLIKRQIAVVVVEGFVPPPPSAAALSGREDERPPRQPGRGGVGSGRSGQSRSQAGAGRGDQNRGQPRTGNKQPANGSPRAATGGPKPASAGGANPARNPRPAAATGAPTPNRRESHNASHNTARNTARPQAALFSGKPTKSGE
jgi:ATP-dependent RNA helicase RhlE